jgi:hypothetical protein
MRASELEAQLEEYVTTARDLVENYSGELTTAKAQVYATLAQVKATQLQVKMLDHIDERISGLRGV